MADFIWPWDLINIATLGMDAEDARDEENEREGSEGDGEGGEDDGNQVK